MMKYDATRIFEVARKGDFEMRVGFEFGALDAPNYLPGGASYALPQDEDDRADGFVSAGSVMVLRG
mgnify:CR=1 FL=1